MGRKKKRIPVFMLLLLFLQIDVFAAQTGRFLESYETAEGQVTVYCTNLGEGEAVLAEQFTAALGSQEAAVTETTLAGEMGTPVTVYCLVDVSGSMSVEQMAQAKAVLTSVCGGLNETDNMVIGSLGNDLSESDFLTDKNEMYDAIETLAAKHEDTNLYKGIVSSIQTLKENGKVNQKKCLLIISDGVDEQKSGITQSEVERAVTQSSIPVCTVAALKSSQTDEEIAAAKLLGSFARMSAGGMDYVPALDGTDAGTVGESILLNLRNGIVLTLDTSQIKTNNKDTLLLRIVYTAADQSIREDTMNIFTEDLVFAEPDDEILAEEPEIGEEPVTPPESKPAVLWPVAVAGTAAVLIVAAVLAATRKNRRKKQDKEKEPETDSDLPLPVMPEKDSQTENAENRKPLFEVKFTAIGYEGICFVLQLEEGRIATLGRDNRADFILNPEDRRLSGIHCKVQCLEHALRVWDLDTTNGTFINGVPLKGSLCEWEAMNTGLRSEREEHSNE